MEPGTGRISTLGKDLKGKFKWLRGQRALDGSIIGIPAHADAVLRIVPSTGEVRRGALQASLGVENALLNACLVAMQWEAGGCVEYGDNTKKV